MRTREVLQIAVTPDGKLVALCSDSTIWVKNDEWIQVKEVPGLELPELFSEEEEDHG